MRVGYARVSTTEQNIEAQLERLADCEKVVAEKKTGSLVERPELAAALEWVREGDTLVATRIDRLARSVAHLCEINEELDRKKVHLHILDQAIDTSTPTGKLMFHLLAAIAEFELTMKREAQRAGIAYARSLGKPTGRRRVIGPEEARQIIALAEEGTPIRAIASMFHRKRSTVGHVVTGRYGYGATLPDNRLQDASETQLEAVQ